MIVVVGAAAGADAWGLGGASSVATCLCPSWIRRWSRRVGSSGTGREAETVRNREENRVEIPVLSKQLKWQQKQVERNDHERKERRQKREATIRESENAEREKVQRRVNERRHKKGRDQTPFEIRTKKAKREITESKQGQRKSKKAENEVETA